LCDETSLKKLKVLKEYNGELKVTNALLLFSDDHHKSDYFPYAKIECGRFKGTTVDTFIDRKTYDGNILDQVELAYEFVLRHINQSAVTEGVYTKTRWQYPVKAIREVIRNAVIHRDYSLTGKDIKIAVYDDMIEVTSPGRLLPSVDFDNMDVRQSEIRNKVLAPFFKHLGLIDQWGNGLKLISEELKKFPDIKLNWSEVGLQFQVQFIIKNYKAETEGLVEGLVKSQQAILRIIEKNPLLSKKEMAANIGISTTALDKNIETLKKKGLLQRRSLEDSYLIFGIKAAGNLFEKLFKSLVAVRPAGGIY